MHTQQHPYYSSKPRSWKGTHPVTSRQPGQRYGQGRHAGEIFLGLGQEMYEEKQFRWPKLAPQVNKLRNQKWCLEGKKQKSEVVTGNEAQAQWLEGMTSAGGA